MGQAVAAVALTFQLTMAGAGLILVALAAVVLEVTLGLAALAASPLAAGMLA
jgi:hypothetical protein